ncbi:MAG: hypothetical protein IPL61_39800 [Myxococcales bacterium]|nr:hypothetical protein [Myxococcales bacterium]
MGRPPPAAPAAVARRAAIVIALVLGGCAGHDTPGDAPDAPGPDAAAVDASAPDAGVCVQAFPVCAAPGTPTPALCAGAVALTPGMALTGQDTAGGGYGDCGASASGIGGPSRYYAITIPPGQVARVVAAPADVTAPALVRALDGCAAVVATESDRGGALTDGRAAVCLANAGAVERHAIIAVSQYSGEADCLPLVFDLTLELRDPDQGCQTGG